jgi:hypothetical protein
VRELWWVSDLLDQCDRDYLGAPHRIWFSQYRVLMFRHTGPLSEVAHHGEHLQGLLQELVIWNCVSHESLCSSSKKHR